MKKPTAKEMKKEYDPWKSLRKEIQLAVCLYAHENGDYYQGKYAAYEHALQIIEQHMPKAKAK